MDGLVGELNWRDCSKCMYSSDDGCSYDSDGEYPDLEDMVSEYNSVYCSWFKLRVSIGRELR